MCLGALISVETDKLIVYGALPFVITPSITSKLSYFLMSGQYSSMQDDSSKKCDNNINEYILIFIITQLKIISDREYRTAEYRKFIPFDYSIFRFEIYRVGIFPSREVIN